MNCGTVTSPSQMVMDKRRHRSRKTTSRQESGSALVEFSVASLPLALLLCGICQYGFIYAAHLTVRNATVAAARYAVLVTTTNTPTPDQIRGVARNALGPMLSTNSATATIDVDQNVTVGPTNGATSVAIHYTLPLVIPWVVPGKGAGDSLTLNETTIMR